RVRGGGPERAWPGRSAAGGGGAHVDRPRRPALQHLRATGRSGASTGVAATTLRRSRGYRPVVRVLLVTDWTANEGGIETYVARVSDALRDLGHEVRLLTSSISAAARARADYVAPATDNPVAQTFLQIANPLAAKRTRAAVSEFRPDVALVNTFEKYLSPAVFQALRG